MEPSDYFRRQIFAAAFPDDPGIAEVMERVGLENVVFSSDWPHNEQVADEFDDGVAYVKARTDLTDEQKQALLYTNAPRWFPS
jgi:predicted TIM-barrel fold metal-dependent hydrolase